jgi:hypothetical protein
MNVKVHVVPVFVENYTNHATNNVDVHWFVNISAKTNVQIVLLVHDVAKIVVFTVRVRNFVEMFVSHAPNHVNGNVNIIAVTRYAVNHVNGLVVMNLVKNT